MRSIKIMVRTFGFQSKDDHRHTKYNLSENLRYCHLKQKYLIQNLDMEKQASVENHRSLSMISHHNLCCQFSPLVYLLDYHHFLYMYVIIYFLKICICLLRMLDNSKLKFLLEHKNFIIKHYKKYKIIIFSYIANVSRFHKFWQKQTNQMNVNRSN